MDSPEIELGFSHRWYEEGRARFIAPIFEATSAGEPRSPTKTPVFYNPYSKLSRDLTILVLNSMGEGGLVAAEPLAGCGVRGIRLLLETSTVRLVHLNDINSDAVRIMTMNSHFNKVSDRVRITHGDANIFLAENSPHDRRFHYVDIDPVGSPSRFIENGLRACRSGGLIGVSATDLAPLVGRHPSTCLRKYDAVSFVSEFSKELALRILAGFIVRRGLPLNIAAIPKLAIYHRHFIRVFLLVERGRGKCLRLLKEMGWLQYCRTCLKVRNYSIAEPVERLCGKCGKLTDLAGPLWLGTLHDPALVASMKANSREYPHAGRILAKVLDEVNLPAFISVGTLASRLHLKPVSPKRLVEALRERGYQASLTHVSPDGVKTNAPLEELREVIADL
ncbi:MAG: tRNA (guanine(26)-N(2))-dimethyltransferase [Nitrososphaerota archaeon]